ncbi:MAG: type II toxin-antitoxin system YafQ family toxin [Caulobacteraceae bacterium]
MKSPASSKRARRPRLFGYAKDFQMDWDRLERAGRYDMRLLKEAMLLLIANDVALGPEWKDHPLTGDWADHRECHVGGDFLLVYRLDKSARPDEAVVFVRVGTHAELFRE